MLEHGEQLGIRVQTVPGCRLLYNGEAAEGVKQFIIGEGNAQSDEIQLLSTNPGTVRVSAHILSGPGGQDQTDIQFVNPRPARIFFDDQIQSIPSTQAGIPLTLRLADQDMVPIQAAQQTYKILLLALSDVDIIHFTPPGVIVGPGRPSAYTVLHLDGAPSSGQILFQAKDQMEVLEPTNEKAITIASSLRSVALMGPREVRRGRSCILTVNFADADHMRQRADWSRWIEFNSTEGIIEPKKIEIRKGEESAQVTFKASGSVKAVSITAESTGLEPGQFTIQVTTPAYLLVLFSGLGGMIGGFFRLSKDRINRVLPKRVDGSVEFGLLVNTAASFVFGLVIFQAIRLGLVVLPTGVSPDWGTRTVAFVFGVIGGYAGLAGLDYLVDKIFGIKEQAKKQAAGQ